MYEDLVNGDSNNKQLPPVTVSEAHISEQAPGALAFLRRHGAEDLIDMLGLRPHAEGV